MVDGGGEACGFYGGRGGVGGGVGRMAVVVAAALAVSCSDAPGFVYLVIICVGDVAVVAACAVQRLGECLLKPRNDDERGANLLLYTSYA